MPHSPQRGHPVDGPLEDRADVVPVLRQRAEGEVPGHTVEVPHLAPGLEESGHDLAGLLLEVGVVAGVAQHRRVGVQAERLADDVEVLAGLQRHVDPDLGGEVAGPDSGGQHHRLGVDAALLGVDAGYGTVLRAQPGDGCVLDDAHAPASGALGQGHGGVHRGGVAVAGNVQRADEVVGADQRPTLAQFVHADLAGLHPDRDGHGRAPPDLLPALGVGRYRD